jgi:hypothetical protein
MPGRLELAEGDMTCSVDGCDRIHVARGLCHYHYKRAWEHGEHLAYARMVDRALVCVCPVPRPTRQWGGQCDHCARPVVQLWPPARYLAALRAYPQIADQEIDWSLRMPAPPTAVVAS